MSTLVHPKMGKSTVWHYFTFIKTESVHPSWIHMLLPIWRLKPGLPELKPGAQDELHQSFSLPSPVSSWNYWQQQELDYRHWSTLPRWVCQMPFWPLDARLSPNQEHLTDLWPSWCSVTSQARGKLALAAPDKPPKTAGSG